MAKKTAGEGINEYKTRGLLYNFTPGLLYGIHRWGDLFNSHQKLTLNTFMEKVRKTYQRMVGQASRLSSSLFAKETNHPIRATYHPIQTFTQTQRKLPHWQIPGSIYFVTFHSIENLSFTPEERSLILRACRHWEGKKITIYAVVVMPTHVHLLIKPLPVRGTTGTVVLPGGKGKSDMNEAKDFFNLSEIMHSIKSYTAHEIKKLRKQQGYVWIHESYDRIIRDEAEFQDKLRYIYENPIKEGLVKSDKEYPWLYFGEGEGDHSGDNRDGCPTSEGGDTKAVT